MFFMQIDKVNLIWERKYPRLGIFLKVEKKPDICLTLYQNI